MPNEPCFRPSPTRRAIMVGALLGAGSLAIGYGCSSSNQARNASGARRAQSRKLGVALVGLGNYSESELGPALKKTKHCELRGIVTGSPDKVAKWRSEYDLPEQSVYSYESLPRIADNPAIDVVYVVTPTALHAKYAIMAANAGKHVWCEKPMAMNVEECQAMIDACRGQRVSLSIGYRLHHEPNTQTVMQYARDKPYGPIRRVSAIVGDRSDGAPSWRMDPKVGGGALYDLGVYAVNALRYSTGEEPTRVIKARQWAERPEEFREVDEDTEFELAFPSGAIGLGRASCSTRDNRLRIEAERGWYELEPMQAYTGVDGETSDGRKLDREVDNQQAKQMDDDALAILEHRQPMVPGEEGLRDVRIIRAIIAAAQSGAPVPIQGG
jgi:glucose-fructose oxidoreductase